MRLFEQDFIDALTESRGLIFLAAERLGCRHSTVARAAKKWPRVRRVIFEFRGRRIDEGEAALDKAVSEGQAWAVRLLLTTLGKKRGYVRRQEVLHGGAPDAPPIRVLPLEELRKLPPEQLLIEHKKLLESQEGQ